MTKKVKGFFTILNEKGLHTRPSTELVRCAAQFKSQITLHYQEYSVSAKSILGILLLAATKGSRIRIEAVGYDAEEAVKAIRSLAKQKFKVKY